MHIWREALDVSHILVISLDRDTQARLDAGEYVFPEDAESHEHSIVCPYTGGCGGWIGCQQPHEVDGKSASCGPEDCICDDGQPSCLGEDGGEHPPWYDQEDFEFHGVMHTWRHGHGWTVPYDGCIVRYNSSYDLPYEYDELPLGEHEVDAEWDDTGCTLVLVPEAAKQTRVLNPQV